MWREGKKSDSLSLRRRNRQPANIAQRTRRVMTQKHSRKGPRSAIAAVVALFATERSHRCLYRYTAVIWHDLNDETKYKRAKAKVTPTCASPEKRKVRLTRWFSPTDGSLILSLSHPEVFLELQTEKKKFVSIRRKFRVATRLTSQMYLGTYDREKPRRLVNLTELLDIKRNVTSKIYHFLSLQKIPTAR